MQLPVINKPRIHVELKIDRVIKVYLKCVFGNETNCGRSFVKEALTSHSRNDKPLSGYKVSSNHVAGS